MTIFRCERVLTGLALAAALVGCEAPAPKAPADSLAAILEEPKSQELLESLDRYVEARKSDPARLDRELRAAGFRRADEASGCTRHAYTGERKKILSLDQTLHVLIEQCGSAPQRTISVRRGDK